MIDYPQKLPALCRRSAITHSTPGFISWQTKKAKEGSSTHKIREGVSLMHAMWQAGNTACNVPDGFI